MQTLTFKLKVDEYKDYTDIFDAHDIILLNGARGVGKSYPTAEYISKMLQENQDAKFVYMRIDDSELHTVISWAKDLKLEDISMCPQNIISRGKPNKGDILLRGFDDNGACIYERIIGKCISLESSHYFKSGNYSEFVACVFEEYTRAYMHPLKEEKYIFNFLENIHTLFRNRPKKVFCIGNNLQSIPLFEQEIKANSGNEPDDIFSNPIKIKIFRPESRQAKSKYQKYLRGELYDTDDFVVKIKEFEIIYINKDFTMLQHIIHPDKYLIRESRKDDYIEEYADHFNEIKVLIRRKAKSEFYFRDAKIEKYFKLHYKEFIEELTEYLCEKGRRYL